MRNRLTNQWSVLGLILLGTSALMSAIAPSPKEATENKNDCNGKLTATTLDPEDMTCRTLLEGEIPSCHRTITDNDFTKDNLTLQR